MAFDNAITLLKKDHLLVKGMFKALKALDKLDLAGRDKLFGELKRELDAHAHIEETIFYPAVRKTDPKNEELIKDSYQDHAEVKDLLEELAEEDKGTPEWSIKLEELEQNVTEHVKEEEDILLPEAEKILGKEQLEEIGKQLKAEKEKIKQAV